MEKNLKNKTSFYENSITSKEVIFDDLNTYIIKNKRNNENFIMNLNYESGKFSYCYTKKLNNNKCVEIEGFFYIEEELCNLDRKIKNNKVNLKDIIDIFLDSKPEYITLSKWNCNGLIKKEDFIYTQKEERTLFIEMTDKSKKIFVQGTISGSNKDYEICTKPHILKAEYTSLRNDLCRLFCNENFGFRECQHVFQKHNNGLKFEFVSY